MKEQGDKYLPPGEVKDLEKLKTQKAQLDAGEMKTYNDEITKKIPITILSAAQKIELLKKNAGLDNDYSNGSRGGTGKSRSRNGRN
jgi:hypothetical protein